MTIYTFDPTGLLVANRVIEVQTPSNPFDATKPYIIPNAAPFFKIGLVVRKGNTVAAPLAVEGTDYLLRHRFLEASFNTGKQLYGSIVPIGAYSGPFYIEYQTVGGSWVVNVPLNIKELTNSFFHLNTVAWDELGLYMPDARFPPVAHDHDADDLTGMIELLVKMQGLIDAVAANDSGGIAATLSAHIAATSGAHNKSAVGLGDVSNLPVADEPTAQAGTSNLHYLTVLRGKQLLDALGATFLRNARNIGLTGDATGAVSFDGTDNVNIPMTLTDRNKFIETTSFASLTENPDTSTNTFFMSAHANTPNAILLGTETAQKWFILTFGHSTASAVTRKSQIAVEHNATATTRFTRVAVRHMNTSNVWSTWKWISNQQLGNVDGRVYGTGYTDEMSPGTNASFDTILDNLFLGYVASVELNGLPRGRYFVENMIYNPAGTLPDVNDIRLQRATRSDATFQQIQDFVYIRRRSVGGGGTWTDWTRVDSNGAKNLLSSDLDAVTYPGLYRQNDNTSIDLLSLNYPVEDNGVLLVQSSVNDNSSGVRQTYYPHGDLSVYARRSLNSIDWTEWKQVFDTDGLVSTDSLPTNLLNGLETPEEARDALELQNGALYTIVISETEPTPAPMTLWFQPEPE